MRMKWVRLVNVRLHWMMQAEDRLGCVSLVLGEFGKILLSCNKVGWLGFFSVGLVAPGENWGGGGFGCA
jgi:hypothetical protein